MRLRDLWTYWKSDAVAFATDEVGRIFIACDRCRRVQPHYRAYPPEGSPEPGTCRSCGGAQFRATRLPEWKAAWWVLVIGWFWRKTVRKQPRWDPRLPLRRIDGSA